LLDSGLGSSFLIPLLIPSFGMMRTFGQRARWLSSSCLSSLRFLSP
jgi:hypothetical protein